MCHWKKCWTIILSSYNYACNQGQRHVTLILRANLRLLFFFFVNALHAISSCKFDKGPVVLNIRYIARRRKAVLSEIILEGEKIAYVDICLQNRIGIPAIWGYDPRLICRVYSYCSHRNRNRETTRGFIIAREVSPLHVKVFQSYEKCVCMNSNF